MVLLSGEAGHGKTSLVKALIESLDHRHRLLTASCEPLGIPPAFAPLFDIANELPERLRRDIDAGAGRSSVYTGMLDVLKTDRVVLVVEDIHWADEATLGLIRYLGRRIETTGSTLIVTFRSEEIALNPPLRLVVADLGPTSVRIHLPPLTPAGVETMIGDNRVDHHELHYLTRGNPFFIEEVLRHPDQELPQTIQNAVLANAQLLPEAARDILNMVALGGSGIPLDWLAETGTDYEAHLDQAIERGLLQLSGDRVLCRHELIRNSLLGGMSPTSRVRLHQRLLERHEGEEATDISRLAYHSFGAGDQNKAVLYSLRAASEASKAGARRQSAFHYANALTFAGAMDTPTLHQSLLDAAKEHSAINDFEPAVAFTRRRLDLANGPEDSGKAFAWLAFFESRRNDLNRARTAAETGIALLEGLIPTEELCLALAVHAWVDQVEGRLGDAKRRGEEASALARGLGAIDMEVFAATIAGSARAGLGDRAGLAAVEEAARLGLTHEAGEFAARALNSLGVISLSRGNLDRAREWLGEVQRFATSRELEAWYVAATTTVAHIDVMSGNWRNADRALEIVAGQRTCRQTEIEALQAVAMLRVRRGEPGAEDALRAATESLEGFNDVELTILGCALMLEASWVGLVPVETAAQRYEQIQSTPAIQASRPGLSLLAFWAYRLGLDPPGPLVGGPAGLEQAGRLEEATAKWEKIGLPIEASITRSLVPGADLREVFNELESMGAHGVARGLRRELARRGTRNVPRGTNPSTKHNPHGLTHREFEVLGLIATGLSNSALARELFVSEKTAGHHVSSILKKLNVNSRTQAASLAIASGWVDIKGHQVPAEVSAWTAGS